MTKKSIIASAAILTLAGIITRLLGFVYRIYMSNLIGAEGMGLYQLIMPVYALAWSLSCSGFTTTLSKLTAQEKAKGQYGNMSRFLNYSIVITSLIGMVIGVALFFFSEAIATYIFKEPRIILSLKILAFSFPFMAAGSCVRGYFFGLHEASIPAVSQVFEQFVRMFFIYMLASTLMPLGIEYAAAAAVIGIVAGEILSFLYVIYAYSDFKKKNTAFNKPSITSSKSLTTLVAMSMPLTLNRVSGSLLSTVENVLIPRRLMVYGLSNTEAISEFGKITGMAMPLIQFPSVILVSLAISLVPAISEAMAVKNYKKINFTVSKTMLFTTVIGIGASGAFILFADMLGYVIYNQDISRMLLYLGILSPFLYMQMVLSGVLNGLGEQVFIFRNGLISSVISISFIYFAVPVLGISGFILGWFISLLVLCTLNLERIKKIANIEIDPINWFFKPIVSVTVSFFAIGLVKNYIYNTLGDILGLIVSVTLMGVMYLALIVFTGCVNKNDFKVLKRGSKS